jgi:DNA-binding CsgD family transcriptional regulator
MGDVLVGRHEERREIEQLLDSARRGASGVLVLRGEAGIGKTALLEHAASTANGMRVVRTRGLESESELSFAGLLELLRPLLGHLDRLPERQATAVRSALALEEADSSDRFAVYAGTLGLLGAAAEKQPLLALIDDAHWLDEASAQALAFASRRLGNEAIGVLWAIREGEPTSVSTEGLRELPLGGLDPEAALELIATTTGDLAPPAARELVHLADGNPLALLELPATLTDGQRAGREPLEQPLPVSPALGQTFGRRVRELSESPRMLLLLAAANDSAEIATVVRAAELLELDPSQLEAAERVGLVTVGDGQLEFRHPLVRAAVYANADPGDRREAHRALAEALVDARAQARRAWHRAFAAIEPDEDVAAELEATARRSQRGSHAAARAYEQAARLTPNDEGRARRLLAAAREWEAAGRNEAAKQLLDETANLTADAIALGGVEHLLGRIAAAQGEAAAASELLERAAARVEERDPERAALILADVAEPWLASGNLDRARAAASRAWELARRHQGVTELWAALRYADVLGWGAEVEDATELWLHAAQLPPGDDLRSRCAVGEALFSAGEDARAAAALTETIEAARTTSALGFLPYALHVLSLVELRRGRLAASAEAAAEAHDLARALDQPGERLSALSSLAWLDALLGHEAEWREHASEATELRRRLRHETYADLSQGMLALTLGHFDDALRHFQAGADPAGRRIDADAIAPRSFVPNFVEAAIRAGRPEEGRAALVRYKAVAERSGRASALAPGLRCGGLLERADRHFEAALREHDRWENAFELARTQLAYGEHLRRRKRRAEARVQLRAAIAGFEEVGAAAWAERASSELHATGERARRRDPSTLDVLTPQELNVARLVATGLTNREVAERLFLSPKTIETHLGHVFRKTGVRTRAELAHRFRDSPDSIAAATP